MAIREPFAMINRVQINVVANVVGRGWSNLITFIFVPLYIKFIGVEAYGLVGFFVTLQAVFNMLDFGFSTTLNREIAIRNDQADTSKEIGNTVRTIEIVYWGFAAVICVSVTLLSPFIARHWVNPENLSVNTVQDSVFFMGLVIALRFPTMLYSGGLMGLQRQVLLNGIIIGVGTLRGVVTVMVLWLISPDIKAFFICQAFMGLIETSANMFFLWISLPCRFFRASFDLRVLRRIGVFTAGVSGIGISFTLMAQVDKIILSKIVSLEIFGYYCLAATVASGLQSLMVHPVLNAVFPELSRLVNKATAGELASLYHRACQAVSLLIVPAGIVVAFFSGEILTLWTGNSLVAENAWRVLSILIAGTILNSFMILPYGLQLASGWTSLTLTFNIAAIVLIIPSLVVSANSYGAEGAALVWLLLNCAYIIVVFPLMHRRLLVHDKMRWIINDLLTPLLTGLTIVILLGALLKAASFWTVFQILLTLLSAYFFVAMSMDYFRRMIFVNIRKIVSAVSL